MSRAVTEVGFSWDDFCIVEQASSHIGEGTLIRFFDRNARDRCGRVDATNHDLSLRAAVVDDDVGWGDDSSPDSQANKNHGVACTANGASGALVWDGQNVTDGDVTDGSAGRGGGAPGKQEEDKGFHDRMHCLGLWHTTKSLRIKNLE